MTRTVQFILSLLICFIISADYSLADHNETLTLHFHDNEIIAKRDSPTHIFLKRELKHRYPNVNISRLELKKVIILAKSRKGHGSARLRVGREISARSTIAGRPKDYYNPAGYTFDRIKFHSPSYNSNGPWQLLLNGHIVLRKIIIVLENNYFAPSHQYRPASNIDDQSYVYTQNNQRHSYSQQKPNASKNALLPIVLPARVWGTAAEGERRCGQKSQNAKDGWDYPDTVCNGYGRATYRSGYQPVKLFIKPDIRPLDSYSQKRRVSELKIRFAASAEHDQKVKNPLSATIGIDIDGKTFTKNIYLDANTIAKQDSSRHSLAISGSWNHKNIRKSRIWIQPHSNSIDFSINSLQLVATDMH